MRVDWQEATYYYTNTAPQWQGINNGNWKDVEHTVRKLADKTGLDLEVRTCGRGFFKVGTVAVNIFPLGGGGGGVIFIFFTV